MTDRRTAAARRLGATLALPPAVLLLSAGPAAAVPPERWPALEPVRTLDVVVLLVLVPLAIFAAVTIAVLVPSMARGDKYTPGLAWRNENEWFGGPRGGVEALEKSESQPTGGASAKSGKRGGASARW